MPAATLSGSQSNVEDRNIHQDDQDRASSRVSGQDAGEDQEPSDESSPLLPRNEDVGHDSGQNTIVEASQALTPSLDGERLAPNKKGSFRSRWPTVIALTSLTIATLLIIALGFATPAIVEEYAQQAAAFEPKNLSFESFTAKGVNARVQGDFVLDASKVQGIAIRDLGKVATWIARAVEARPLSIDARLPDYEDITIAKLDVPPLVVSTRNGDITRLNFVAAVDSDNLDAIRSIANEWLQGRLTELRVEGYSRVALKSGIFSLGTQHVTRGIVFQGSDLPSLPTYDIKKLQVHEIDEPSSNSGIHVDVEIAVSNEHPLSLSIPSLSFDVLVPGCSTLSEKIVVANAITQDIHIQPKAIIRVAAQAVVRSLPDTLLTLCPGSQSSPLDALLSSYLHGLETRVLIKGSSSPTEGTPLWLSELLENVVLPVPVTGHSFKNLIDDFSMKDVHFSMPNPLASPESPSSKPRISATVRVQAKLPEEMNFSIHTPRVRAGSSVYFKGKKFGNLDLRRWQPANSLRTEAEDGTPRLVITSAIIDAPLNVTDDAVLGDVVQEMLLGEKDVVLGVKASVDAEVATILGTFVVRSIPAQGRVPIRPFSGHRFGDMDIHVGNLEIIKTTEEVIILNALVNFTNPTNYSASLPYAGVNLSWNGTKLGSVTVQDVTISPGENLLVPVTALWDPARRSGEEGVQHSRELISRYVSGYNTTLTLSTHSQTIPFLPNVGRALSRFPIKIETPKLSPAPTPGHPKHPSNDQPHFIDDATMHLWSSTATFTLLSPLHDNTIYLTHINATAIYNHTDPVGNILYNLPFAVPPGISKSPRLPVDWSIGGVGYDAVRDALGGTLKLDARAQVGIRIGRYVDRIWFEGHGIGAHIKI